jgi:hypothetical protein
MTIIQKIKECLGNDIKEYHYILLELKREFPNKTVAELKPVFDNYIKNHLIRRQK